jgi:hypothetical protein
LLVFLLFLVLPAMAAAAAPPEVEETWSAEVTASSARLFAAINPGGTSTSYHFDFIPASQYEANLAQGAEAFAGGGRAPVGLDQPAGSGTTRLTVSQILSGLTASTPYRYR